MGISSVTVPGSMLGRALHSGVECSEVSFEILKIFMFEFEFCKV